MRAFGWAAACLLAAGFAAGVIAVLTGWDSYRVNTYTLAAVVCWLCEKAFSE